MVFKKTSVTLLTLLISGVMLLEWYMIHSKKYPSVQPQQAVVSTSAATGTDIHSKTAETACDPNIVYRTGGLPAILDRGQLGSLLEKKQFERGAEVGVQRGLHASELLSNWKSCQYFALVDVWKQQDNYVDGSNVDNSAQEDLYQETLTRLSPWQDRTQFFRMLSVDAATQMADNSLDFVYIDARHDYCGCTEDLQAYWPKLRPGGIFAGHDYMTAEEARALAPDGDYGICMDGTRNEGAVRGAVEDFAMAHGLTISVSYRDGGFWSTWMVQKPTIVECV